MGLSPLSWLFPTNLKYYMTNQKKKAYIIKNWNRSSGKTITEMLKRYFASEKADTTFEIAEKLFLEVKDNDDELL
jgi:hypothetical protein